jgi:hypothetical protein
MFMEFRELSHCAGNVVDMAVGIVIGAAFAPCHVPGQRVSCSPGARSRRIESPTCFRDEEGPTTAPYVNLAARRRGAGDSEIRGFSS